MGAFRSLSLASALALVLLGPVAGQAQPIDPNVVGDTVRPLLEPVIDTALPPTENESGEDLHGEDIRIAVTLDVLNIDYQIVGILFGGGKVAADAVADLRLEFRALGAERLDQAIRSATGDANASLNATFGVPTGRMALTAEEVRLAGAGVLLEYMQEFEAQAARSFLQDTLPGLTVLDLSLEWQNTFPFSYVTDEGLPGTPTVDPTDPAGLIDLVAVPPLREPPLVLEAQARLNYLSRVSLFDLLRPENETAEQEAKEVEKDAVKQRLQAEQGDRFLDRSAFNLLGFGQVVDAKIPPGWRVEVNIVVPKGFTIEGATDELVLADNHRGAGLALDGLGRAEAANPQALATLSNRFLVTTLALALVVLVGVALRLPLEAGVMALHQRATARRRTRLQPVDAEGPVPPT